MLPPSTAVAAAWGWAWTCVCVKEADEGKQALGLLLLLLAIMMPSLQQAPVCCVLGEKDKDVSECQARQDGAPLQSEFSALLPSLLPPPRSPNEKQRRVWASASERERRRVGEGV